MKSDQEVADISSHVCRTHQLKTVDRYAVALAIVNIEGGCPQELAALLRKTISQLEQAAYEVESFRYMYGCLKRGGPPR